MPKRDPNSGRLLPGAGSFGLAVLSVVALWIVTGCAVRGGIASRNGRPALGADPLSGRNPESLPAPRSAIQEESPAAHSVGKTAATARKPEESEIRQVDWRQPARPEPEPPIAGMQRQDPAGGTDQLPGRVPSGPGQKQDEVVPPAPDGRQWLRPQPGGYSLGTRPASLNPLMLEEVLGSLETVFPPLLAAAQEREIALGELVSRWGEFDTQVRADTLNAPLGFYENNRHSLSVTQPVLNSGGYVYGGYRLGRGGFQPWYKERQTNQGGEFAVGTGMPLLKDRAIDDRRAALATAEIGVQLTDPYVRSQLNLFARDAIVAYWKWIAAGLVLQVQEELLQLAQNRVHQIESRVREGDLPEIARIDNERFVLARQTKLVESDQKFREASIRLSLFLRDADGAMLVPDLTRLPDFPAVGMPDPGQLAGDLQTAWSQRPELQEIALQIRQQQVQRELACNGLLPKLDAVAQASQDLGGAANSPDDKGPFELEAGLVASLPVQRRGARGKLAAATARLRQLEIRRQYAENRVANELQSAMVALTNAAQQFELARNNLNLTRRALEVGRLMFDEGDIDLILLNIYEQAVTDAELSVIHAELEYFSAAADYRLGLGLASSSGGLNAGPLPPAPDFAPQAPRMPTEGAGAAADPVK